MFRFFWLFFILPLFFTSYSYSYTNKKKKCHEAFAKESAASNRTYRKEWTSYEVQALIQLQDVITEAKFDKKSKSKKRSFDIPSDLLEAYKEEWEGWRDSLGMEGISQTSKKQTRKREWMPYREAQALVQSLGIEDQGEFYEWSKSGRRPFNFPSRPWDEYEEWSSLKSFLGTEGIKWTRRKRRIHKKRWMPYREAQSLIQSVGIETKTEFDKWAASGKRPFNFPSRPWDKYEEWKNWPSFLGTEEKKRQIRKKKKIRKKRWMPYEEAQSLIQSVGIKIKDEFDKWAASGKRPFNFPSHPEVVYKEEWKGWKSFLGTEGRKRTNRKKQIRKKERVSYEGVQVLIQSKDIKVPERGKNPIRRKQTHGEQTHRKPTHREEIHDREWMNYEAQAWFQSLGIKTQEEIQERSGSGEKLFDFLSDPLEMYKEEWKGWRDSLGMEGISQTPKKQIHEKEWMNYEKLQSLVQSLGIGTRREFIKWVTEQGFKDIPIKPEIIYKEEWENWYVFLGREKPEQWMDYEEAQHYAIKIAKLEATADLIRWLKSDDRPEDFPSNPHEVYIEWNTVYDFLGVQWPSYEKAHSFNQDFFISTKEAYYELRRDRAFEMILPPNPAVIYKEDWTGWEDYLAQ